MSRINLQTIKQGDILLVNFPYNDKIGSKIRPAVVSKVKGNQLFITKITSQIKDHPNNVTIENLNVAGLKKPSQIQCNREISINPNSKKILDKIGHLDERDLNRMNQKILEIRLERYAERQNQPKNAIEKYCQQVAEKSQEPLLNREHEKQKERGR